MLLDLLSSRTHSTCSHFALHSSSSLLSSSSLPPCLLNHSPFPFFSLSPSAPGKISAARGGACVSECSLSLLSALLSECAGAEPAAPKGGALRGKHLISQYILPLPFSLPPSPFPECSDPWVGGWRSRRAGRVPGRGRWTRSDSLF